MLASELVGMYYLAKWILAEGINQLSVFSTFLIKWL
jgi:hypothetical protein